MKYRIKRLTVNGTHNKHVIEVIDGKVTCTNAFWQDKAVLTPTKGVNRLVYALYINLT